MPDRDVRRLGWQRTWAKVEAAQAIIHNTWMQCKAMNKYTVIKCQCKGIVFVEKPQWQVQGGFPKWEVAQMSTKLTAPFSIINHTFLYSAFQIKPSFIYIAQYHKSHIWLKGPSNMCNKLSGISSQLFCFRFSLECTSKFNLSAMSYCLF